MTAVEWPNDQKRKFKIAETCDGQVVESPCFLLLLWLSVFKIVQIWMTDPIYETCGASSAPGEQRFTHHTKYEYAMTVFAVPSVLLVLPDCDDIGIFHVLGHSSLLPDRGVSGVSQGLGIWHTRAMVDHHCFLNSTCLSLDCLLDYWMSMMLSLLWLGFSFIPSNRSTLTYLMPTSAATIFRSRAQALPTSAANRFVVPTGNFKLIFKL